MAILLGERSESSEKTYPFANGVRVEPGDIAFADIERVVVIPKKIEDELIGAALETLRGENMVRKRIQKGTRTRRVWDEYGIMWPPGVAHENDVTFHHGEQRMQLYTKTSPRRATADGPRPSSRFSRRLCQFLLFAVGLPTLADTARGADQTSAWPRERLVGIERPRILDRAERYLKELPRTVTANRCGRGTGGPHDNCAEGDYGWPNPADPDGPYIRRDGETNPGLFYARRQSLVRLSEIVGTLTSAYVLTDDERYAAHSGAPTADEVRHNCVIHVASAATGIERLAANELARYLKQLHPSMRFVVETEGTGDICLGTLRSLPQLKKLLSGRAPVAPEGYVVTHATIDERPTGVICGTDPAGVLYGVYGLLEHLGVGFLLNGDRLPRSRSEPLSFAGWNLIDQPLVPTRIVFDWHNFLSGCSTWNVEHWRQWIVQSQKMGYNTVMVHAYGNNPMAGFEFKGLQKPVGYLSSTRLGRDWSTNHVNDVRRLFGGDVFHTAVFGCDAAVNGTDQQRTRAAQSLMAQAFAAAEARGVDVYFAVDVDTTSANPQQLIRSLPEHARFEIDVKQAAWMGQPAGKMQLVNPETPEGYAFYQAQVRQLLDVYPQIDCLVVWHRKSATPWMEFAFESMPRAWQQEYTDEVTKTPDARGLYHSHHLFALAKIVTAFQRAVKELGRADVKVAFGSWDFHFLPAAHRFMPQNVALIPLDWSVLKDDSVFDTRPRRLAVAKVAATRPVIPIAWAQHDDGNYVGRPYTPIPDFYDRLTEMKCQTAGYGIIHWTTKPLDLYFQSLVHQVWQSSENEPLETTCRRLARQLVGDEQAKPFAAYLESWVTTMPKIGRETSDFFIDHRLEDLREVEASQRSRLKLLTRIDRSELDSVGREWVDYFRGLEDYILGVHRTEDALHRAKAHYTDGDLDAARSVMATCRPEDVINRFAEFSQLGGLTRGEKGLIVTMNTRWLPHYVRFRQMIAADSVRYNFAPTSHDPLAQSRGVFTFHFDSNGRVWQCLGTEETGAEEFTTDVVGKVTGLTDADVVAKEICRTGIESDKPIAVTLQPILPRGGRKGLSPENLAAGDYQLTLLTIEPDEAAAVGQHVFDLRAEVLEQSRTSHYRLAPTHATYLRLRCRGSNKSKWNSIQELRCDALDRKGPVTASGQYAKYEPRNAVDGNRDTRWAVEGRDHWIQFTLDPKRSFDRLEIDWWEGELRQYDFDILCSTDGKTWETVAYELAAPPRGLLARDRFDVRKAAGGAHKVLARSYPVKLTRPSAIRLTLTPVEGKARICALVLTPAGGADVFSLGTIKEIAERVCPEGMVQWGQAVGGSPFDIRREDCHEYMTDTLLLAAGEICRLATTGHAGEESRQ